MSVKSFIKGDAYNSAPATVVKLFDPTGISSWGDVANAWSDGKFDYQDILEPLGAVPVLGKLGKAGKYLGKSIKGLNDVSDAKKVLKAGKEVYTDVTKVGGRTFKKSFNTKYVSPHTTDEIKAAQDVLRNNKIANYSQYGVRSVAAVDDVLDGKTAFVQSAQAIEKARIDSLKKEQQYYKKELSNMIKFNPSNPSWNQMFSQHEKKLDSYYKKVNELTK